MEGYRTLEVKLISAENLKQDHVSNPFSSKMNAYALVYVSNDPKYEKLKERTRLDRTGGCNPTWNSTFRFVVPVAGTNGGLSLRVVLRTAHGIVDRDVGEVTVPLGELLASSSSSSSSSSVADGDDSFTVSKRLACQVRKRDSEGEEADGGVLNLSYRFLRVNMDTLRPRPGMTEPNLAPAGMRTRNKLAAFLGALFTGLNNGL